MITEGSVKLDIDVKGVVNKKLPVFYNPVMKLNRDTSVEILNKYFGVPPRVALPLSGSGIRGMRFLKECKVKEVHFNDYSDGFVDAMEKRLELNSIDSSNVFISNKDANIFLLGSKGFDYIDVDPFGTPNPFLDAAVQRISRNGILAVTATDTSALAGTYPSVCLRNYDAVPLRNWLKHVVGIRILIRKIQLIGAQYEKALTPVLCYSKDHYYRVFLKCEKSKEKSTAIVKSHLYLDYDADSLEYSFSKHSGKNSFGKMYSGELWDKKYSTTLVKFLDDEIRTEGHYIDIHAFCKKKELAVPNYTVLEERLKSSGYSFSRSHFSLLMIRTTASSVALEKIIHGI
ncbi:MAG: hypothetical protein ACOCUR_01970 [Nanoarchaeota archaeon]